MIKLNITKKKYLTSLLTTELISSAVLVWFISGFVGPWPFETVVMINLVLAGYMISRCLCKNNTARKQTAWLTTEWWAFLLCQWFNYDVLKSHNVDFIEVGACSTGILIVYLITRGITKHNVNRAIIM